MNKSDYEYETRTDKTIETLKKRAEKDEMLDAIEDDLKRIKEKLLVKKKEEIAGHKDQLKKLLEVEIATRYYLQSGKIQSSLSGDKDILEALEILSDKNRYKAILSGDKK